MRCSCVDGETRGDDKARGFESVVGTVTGAVVVGTAAAHDGDASGEAVTDDDEADELMEVEEGDGNAFDVAADDDDAGEDGGTAGVNETGGTEGTVSASGAQDCNGGGAMHGTSATGC